MSLSVQALKRKVASCAANALARAVIDKTSVFANQKIRNFRGQITNDEKQIAVINQALASTSVSSTDKLVLEIRLGTLNDSELSTNQLLLQATQIEAPKILDERRSESHHCAQPPQHRRRRSGDRCDPRRTRGAPVGRHRSVVAAAPHELAMLEGKRVAVVVPAHDEQELIATTLAGIPPFVDAIYVVDDGSRDGTVERARATGDERVEIIAHDRNRGVGAAIVTGYRRALADGIDATCVMAGDNQMDPADLELLALPVVRGELDYAKANRLVTGEAWNLIPRTRYLGNAVLSMLTKIASGYWHVADSQSGYTAISKDMLGALDLDRVYTGYGFPNDFLVHLNVENARVRDFPSRPIYGVGERSGIRYRKVVPRISWLLVRAFFWRLRQKYVIRDFHPLVFFYAFGFLSTLAGLVLGIVEIAYRIAGYQVSVGTVVLIALLLISGSQFMLFAMWFDMETNKDLRCSAAGRRWDPLVLCHRSWFYGVIVSLGWSSTCALVQCTAGLPFLSAAHMYQRHRPLPCGRAKRPRRSRPVLLRSRRRPAQRDSWGATRGLRLLAHFYPASPALQRAAP